MTLDLTKTAADLSQAELAKYLLSIRDAEESFLGFCMLHRDKVVPPHILEKAAKENPRIGYRFPPFQQELILALDELERTEGQSLLITMPPGHCKTSLGNDLFSTYFIGRQPYRRVISLSYSATKAQDVAKRVKLIANDPKTRQTFRHFQISQSASADMDWRTTTSPGGYHADGILGAVTGYRADLLIIDDPIKGAEEAESATIRNKIWNEWVSTLTTRPLPGGRKLIILTRWHPDDLAGRLMNSPEWASDNWRHINFPAISLKDTEVEIARWDLPKDDPRYITYQEATRTKPGQRYVKVAKETALWPDVFSLQWLRNKRAQSERSFASLYQQTPYIQGGNLIKEGWWQQYARDPNSPIGAPQDVHIQAIVIGWDTAFKKTQSADFSVAVVAALGQDGNIYILHIERRRVTFPELKRMAVALNNRYRGRGLVAHYVEDKASGQSLIQELRTESGLSVVAHEQKGDKLTKLSLVLPMIEGGRVYLPSDAPWLDDFMQECVEFPGSAHDDQVDALAIALNRLGKLTMASADVFAMPDLASSLNRQYGQGQPNRAGANNMPNQMTGRAIVGLGASLNGRLGTSWRGWGE